jgi:phospholipase/carboxylesterase
MAEARAQVDALLDALQRDLDVPGDKLILGGFSQGAMLACDVALHSSRPLAGLAMFSTTLLCLDVWQKLIPARKTLPILQTHGELDPLLTIDFAVELRELFRAAGANVDWVQFRGGHELPGPVLEAFARFITQHS